MGSDVFDTVTATVRDWTRFTYEGHLPHFSNDAWSENLRVVDAFRPQFAAPGVYRDCVFVDLSSAYWHIARRVGLDVRFLQGAYLGVNSPIETFPYSDHKIARGLLVSCCLPGGLWWWDGKGGTTFQKTFNPVLAPSFVACVYSVLHGVASDMAELLVYYNVDGGIIRREHLPIWEEVCESWGLPWKSKGAGYAMVRSVGNYSIGRMSTKGEGKALVPHSNLKPRNEWLRRRFKAFQD